MPVVCIVEGRVRVAEIRAVEQIESLGPNLHSEPLGGAQILESGKVHIPGRRSAQNVAPGISKRSRGVRRKCSRVEPLQHRIHARGTPRVAYLVGMVLVYAAQ